MQQPHSELRTDTEQDVSVRWLCTHFSGPSSHKQPMTLIKTIVVYVYMIDSQGLTSWTTKVTVDKDLATVDKD